MAINGYKPAFLMPTGGLLNWGDHKNPCSHPLTHRSFHEIYQPLTGGTPVFRWENPLSTGEVVFVPGFIAKKSLYEVPMILDVSVVSRFPISDTKILE